MRRSKLFISAALLAAALTACVLFPDDAETIALNWGIELPGGYTVAYETDTGASFGGDGLRCHVFTWRDGGALAGMLLWRTCCPGRRGMKKVSPWRRRC